MTFLIYTLHVLICFFLIAVVLLQQGKGADLSVFGGGGTQTAFGARGAATVLHKLSVGSFIAFIVTTLMIGVLQTQNDESGVLSGLPDAAEESAAAQNDEEEAAGALPTEAPEEAVGEDAAAAEGEATEGTDEPAAEGDEAPAADGEAAPAEAGEGTEAPAEGDGGEG